MNSKPTRFFAQVQFANADGQVAAFAPVGNNLQCRIRDNETSAAQALVQDFPTLLQPLAEPEPAVNPWLAVKPAPMPYNPQPTADEKAAIATLTPRELEVVHLLATEGARNAVIADRLGISVITVRHHLSSIFERLGVADRFELCHFAYRTGLAKPVWLTAETFARVNVAQQNSTSEPALADVS